MLTWQFCDFFQEIQDDIAKNPYIFVNFQGGGGGPSRSAHDHIEIRKNTAPWIFLSNA